MGRNVLASTDEELKTAPRPVIVQMYTAPPACRAAAGAKMAGFVLTAWTSWGRCSRNK